MEKRYYTVSETAQILRVSISTVRRAIASGALPSARVGSRGQLRIGQSVLDEYLGSTGACYPSIANSPSLRVSETAPARPPSPVAETAGKTANGLPWRVLNADAAAGFDAIESGSVNCIVTSPPYYWQRDYEVAGQIGHESSINGYVSRLVEVFSHAKRVLADDGLFFLNLGDTYYSAKGRAHGADRKHSARQVSRRLLRAVDGPGLGLPRKSLIGIPWRTALALQDAGWTLRSAIIWYRPSSLPEATSKDRPWRTYEHVFMFAKQPHYWFDRKGLVGDGDVWTLHARPENPGSHFAPYPVELVDRCLAAGCRPGGTVLDPFVGSGTTMISALRRGMPAIGIELKPEYAAFSAQRVRSELGEEVSDEPKRRRA